jgi:putative DNA primase/helicase
MNAATIAAALDGRQVGSGWVARCPAHDDRLPSLSLSEGKSGIVLVHCHAGCTQEQVVAELRQRGLWRAGDLLPIGLTPESAPRLPSDASGSAISTWQRTGRAEGTLVEVYLRSRGLRISAPPTLRFHARLRHASGGAWPAMVALVTRGVDDMPTAIHRTFLALDGSGKAPVAPTKMMLGRCRGGAVRLGEASTTLLVGEGIETCLAAMQATGMPAWAALSTAGLRTLELPAPITDVVVLADGDDAGEEAARVCARRWAAQGRTVRIARPPRGADFCDVLNTPDPAGASQ